jgi:putative nucleotidyltransferase with HDIG domain
MPFTLLTDTKGINFIEHTIAVTEGAISLAKAQMDGYRKLPYKVDMDRLVAGGLLHDVGKLIETESDGSGSYRKSFNGKCARHPISGAILAAKAGLSDEGVNTVACQAKEGEGAPQVVETVFIHQADFATLIEDIRLLTYIRLQNMMALVQAGANFAMVYLNLRTKLRVLAGHVLLVARRVFGIPDFRFYALADGIKAYLFGQKRGLYGCFSTRDPETGQQWLFSP